MHFPLIMDRKGMKMKRRGGNFKGVLYQLKQPQKAYLEYPNTCFLFTTEKDSTEPETRP